MSARNDLIAAAMRNDSVGLRAAIDAGIDLNQADSSGMTALMWAAREGHVLMVRTLLRAGANAHQTDKNGWNARDIALIYREHGMLRYTGESLEIAKMLGDVGVSISHTNMAVLPDAPPERIRESTSAVQAARGTPQR